MIEILYSEVSNLYGDYGNISYLEKNFGKGNVCYTSLNQKPYFLDHPVDLIYLGCSSANSISLIVEKLKSYKKEIKEKIEAGVHFLFTGNAIDVFSSNIGLGIFDIVVKRDYNNRLNCHYLGEYQNYQIIGFKSQFAQYEINQNPFIKTTMGFGANLENKAEGIKYKNFYGTNLLGPFLLLNPLFTKQLFMEIGYQGDILFEKELIKSYEFRLEEYKNLKD